MIAKILSVEKLPWPSQGTLLNYFLYIPSFLYPEAIVQMIQKDSQAMKIA